MSNYNVGDTIAYTPFGGGERIVLVQEKEADVKNGRPGGTGVIAGTDYAVWFYDNQITRVVERAS